MRIAVTYYDGYIFEHFGHSEQFKFYDIVDGAVASSEVVEPDCGGHDAMAAYLADNGVNVVICGGIGDGAKAALDAAGIEVFSGAAGEADAAVELCLKGELPTEGANCDHHDHDHGEGCGCGCGGGCGSDDESGCGGGCGGCGGGCSGGAPMIYLEGPNAGKTVRVHYRGTFEDGTQFDASYDRGEPLEFICGAGMMIRGFDMAVCDMEVGQIVDITIPPELAYGEYDPRAMVSFPVEQMPGAEDVEIGQQVWLQDAMGRPIPVKVHAVDDETITFDCNHELSGKSLNFRIELVEVK